MYIKIPYINERFYRHYGNLSLPTGLKTLTFSTTKKNMHAFFLPVTKGFILEKNSWHAIRYIFKSSSTTVWYFYGLDWNDLHQIQYLLLSGGF